MSQIEQCPVSTQQQNGTSGYLKVFALRGFVTIIILITAVGIIASLPVKFNQRNSAIPPTEKIKPPKLKTSEQMDIPIVWNEEKMLHEFNSHLDQINKNPNKKLLHVSTENGKLQLHY